MQHFVRKSCKKCYFKCQKYVINVVWFFHERSHLKILLPNTDTYRNLITQGQRCKLYVKENVIHTFKKLLI